MFSSASRRLLTYTRHFSSTSLKSQSMPGANKITLYTFGTPNGHKASVTLEELGLQYKCETIDISGNAQKEEWFLKIK